MAAVQVKSKELKLSRQHIPRPRHWLLPLLCSLAGLACAQPASKVTLPAVTPEYFGLVFNEVDGTKPWPSITFGSWRMWDARVTWPNLEPKRGEWNFALLDRMVSDAEAHKTKILLVLAHSPQWASARPAERGGYGLGLAAEPNDLQDWTTYVQTVTKRYKGRIEAYQVWNEPSDKSHFTGTVQNLVDLTCSAFRVIRESDPSAKIVSAGTAGGGYHIDYQEKFLAAGGAKCIDVLAHHFYVPRFGPEAMVPLIRQVREMMRRQGVDNLPLWNTETGWWLANTDATPDAAAVAKGGWRKLDADAEAGAVIQRALLLARSEGVERFYWYSWVNPYGWALADSQGNAKPATRDWNRAAGEMLGHVVRDCRVDKDSSTCKVVDSAGKVREIDWVNGDALTAREGAAATQASKGSRPFAQ